MSKLTYLQIVQRVASAIDTDNVTAIDESPESEQIALLVQTVYDDIIVEFPWYHKRESATLEVTATPNLMRIPDGVEQILSSIIYYDTNPVHWMIPETMRQRLAKRDKDEDTVDEAGAFNDLDPVYWSSYNDEDIVFDSYDGTLVDSLTDVWVSRNPSAPEEGTDIPDLPHILHTVLLHGVLEEAFRTLKGDEVAARSYQSKFLKGIARAKRWARKVNKKKNPGQNVDFGRRNGAITRTEIPSSWVKEGS